MLLALEVVRLLVLPPCKSPVRSSCGSKKVEASGGSVSPKTHHRVIPPHLIFY